WITDRTPHESLPLKKTQYRQFFRLVTSQVSHWYADHSTPNPLGILPTTKIIYGNKFHPTKMPKLGLRFGHSLMWSNPVLRQVILGCYDPSSPLSCLRGKPELLQAILAKVVQAWAAHVNTTTRGFLRLGTTPSRDPSFSDSSITHCTLRFQNHGIATKA
ncbi:unnamed protein product, partial [Aphanomyces euteiches]